MAGGHPVEEVWPIAAAIAAQCHKIPVEWITAPTRGRGWRPPAEAWEAKQHAIAACVVVSGCSYAELGRLIGMHRDTVAHHCAAVRDHDDLQRYSVLIADVVGVGACHKVELTKRTAERRRAQARETARNSLDFLSDDRHSSDKMAVHENVTANPGKGLAA